MMLEFNDLRLIVPHITLLYFVNAMSKSIVP